MGANSKFFKRSRRFRDGLIFCVAVWIFSTVFIAGEWGFANSALAQEVQSIVDPGSSGNEISVQLENISQEKPLEKILMALTDHSSDLKDITVTPNLLQVIPPGGKASFQVRFNVHEKAEPGAVLQMNFSLLTRGGAFADSSPVVFVLVKPGEGEEELPPPPTEMGPSPGGLPVFVLSEISGERSHKYWPWEIEWDGKSAGHVERWRKKVNRSVKKIQTVQATAITNYPKRITLGKPFSFTAQAKRRVHNLKRCVIRGRKHEKNRAKINMGSPIASVEVTGKKDLVAFCDEAGIFKTNHAGQNIQVSTREMQKDGEVHATLTFKPTKIVRDDQGRPVEFFYQPQLSTNGDAHTYGGLKERRFHALGYGRKNEVAIDDEGYFNQIGGERLDGFSFGIMYRSLKYMPATRSSEPLSPPPFKAPESMGGLNAGRGGKA